MEHLLCTWSTSARPWWMNFTSPKRRKSILNKGIMKKKGMKSPNLVGYVEEICLSLLLDCKAHKKQGVVVRWKVGKGCERLSQSSSERWWMPKLWCWAVICWKMFTNCSSKGKYVWHGVCIVCVCVPICASKIHNTAWGLVLLFWLFLYII